MRSAIIIGAGVIGVCTAYALERKGWHVTLVDAAKGPAMGSSNANGAQLSYCYTDALGSPATFAALPKLIKGKGGVTMRLTPDWDYLRWLMTFARNCTPGRFRENTLAVLQLAHESRAAMADLCNDEGFDFGQRPVGKIQLLYSDAEIERARASRELKQNFGCDQQLVMNDDLGQIEPALNHLSETVSGAVFTPSEAVADPFIFCETLVKHMADLGRLECRFGNGVSHITPSSSKSRVRLDNGEQLEAELVAVCTGHNCNRLLAPIGLKLPVQPMKGYSFEMPLTPHSPQISVTDAKRRLVFTNLGDRMRVAGFAELGNWSQEIDARRIEQLRLAAMDCLPQAGDYTQTSRHWAGLRPSTPNSQPIIAHPMPGLAINTGHGSLGWTLAMGSGQRLARMVD